MGTKNNPGAFDCYAAAAPDEPMFVLLGRDKHAPTLVWLWATLRELDGEDPAKVLEARQCASKMMEWAHDKGRPVVGFGQAALAGTMELIRAVNSAAKRMGEEHRNQQTGIEALRMFLAETSFETTDTQGDSPMTLDLPIRPGRYRTRNGRVVTVVSYEGFSYWPWRGHEHDMSFASWTDEGTYFFGECPYDLVERLLDPESEKADE